MQKIEMPNFEMNPSGGLEEMKAAVHAIAEGGEPVAIMNSKEDSDQPIFWIRSAKASHTPSETFDLSEDQFNVFASLMKGLTPNGVAYKSDKQSETSVMLIPTKSALKLTHLTN